MIHRSVPRSLTSAFLLAAAAPTLARAQPAPSVADLTAKYNDINQSITRLTATTRDVPGGSFGTRLTAYFHERTLRTATVEGWLEMGSGVVDYYYWDDRPFFIFARSGAREAGGTEERIYLRDDTLVRYVHSELGTLESWDPRAQAAWRTWHARAEEAQRLARRPGVMESPEVNPEAVVQGIRARYNAIRTAPSAGTPAHRVVVPGGFTSSSVQLLNATSGRSVTEEVYLSRRQLAEFYFWDGTPFFVYVRQETDAASPATEERLYFHGDQLIRYQHSRLGRVVTTSSLARSSTARWWREALRHTQLAITPPPLDTKPIVAADLLVTGAPEVDSMASAAPEPEVATRAFRAPPARRSPVSTPWLVAAAALGGGAVAVAAMLVVRRVRRTS
jgi:hypothetical protein